MKKINKVVSEYQSNKNRDPTEEEISKKTGLSKRTIKNCNAIDNSGIMSLEECRGNGYDYDVDEDKNIENEHENFTRKTLREKMMDLPDRERYIIEKRYFENQTLKQVADKVGLSKERIRQIQKKTLARLRNDLQKVVV